MGRRLMRLAHSFFRTFIDFIYPPLCLVCHSRLESDERFVCERCWSLFHVLEQPLMPADQLDVLHNAAKYFHQSLAIFPYSDQIQELIHLMKYRSMPGIATHFGRALGNLVQTQHMCHTLDMLIPVPLHPLRCRERGFNQATLLAREIAHVTQIPLHDKVLKRIRYTQQQAKFNKEERAANVRNAFRLVDESIVMHKKIGLVDDVLTTGSTMNECAKVLCARGAQQITTITIVRI